MIFDQNFIEKYLKWLYKKKNAINEFQHFFFLNKNEETSDIVLYYQA